MFNHIFILQAIITNKLGFFAVVFTIIPVVVLAITGPLVLLLLLLVVVVVEEGELVVVLPVGVLELDTFFSFGNLFLATLTVSSIPSPSLIT